MASAAYVALLRGINVGGKNPIAMAKLREAFEDEGFDDVRTYIQSGNVRFRTGAPARSLEERVEAMLEKRSRLDLVVVVRSHRQLRGIVDKAPKGFGTRPTTYHSDVVFLRSPLTPAKAMKVVEQRDGVDEATTGTGVVYFQRLSAERTKSRMGRMIGTPEYGNMTIRSWSTVTKLLAMLDDEG